MNPMQIFIVYYFALSVVLGTMAALILRMKGIKK
jgi:hypothetical protein